MLALQHAIPSYLNKQRGFIKIRVQAAPPKAKTTLGRLLVCTIPESESQKVINMLYVCEAGRVKNHFTHTHLYT